MFYAPLRFLGFDRFLSFQLTYVLLSALGFFGFCVLIDRTTTLDRLGKWLLAGTFTFANVLFLKFRHPQLLNIYFLPWVIVLMHVALCARTTRRRVLSATAGGLLTGLALYTAYYMFWFFLMMLPIFGLVFVAIQRRSLNRVRPLMTLKENADVVAGAVVGFGLAMIPFVITYLPSHGKAQAKPWAETLSYAARPGDIFNFGRTNMMWGRIVRAIYNDGPRLKKTEISLALTPVLTLIFLSVVTSVIVRIAKTKLRSNKSDALLALAICAVFIRIVSVKFWFGSLWVVVWGFVPGANPVRAIDRIQILNVFVVAFVIALAIDELRTGNNRSGTSPSRQKGPGNGIHRAIGVVHLVLAIACVEQVNLDSSALNRTTENLLILRTSHPPKQCKSFFISDVSHLRLSWQNNIDAMIIATNTGLPTLNGYSGQPPEDFMGETEAPSYLALMQKYAVAHRVSDHLCRIDRSTLAWSTTPFP